MIIRNLSGPTGARLNEFYCTIIKSFVCVGTFCCHAVQNHSSFPHPLIHWTSTITLQPMLLHPHRTFLSTLFSSNCCKTDHPKQEALQGVLSNSTKTLQAVLWLRYIVRVTSCHRKEYTSNMFHDNSVHYLVDHVGVKLDLYKDCRSLRKMCLRLLTFKHQIKSRLPLEGIIRSSPYAPRF